MDSSRLSTPVRKEPTIRELQDQCRQLGLSPAGRKQVLMDRLKEHYDNERAKPTVDPIAEEEEGMDEPVDDGEAGAEGEGSSGDEAPEQEQNQTGDSAEAEAEGETEEKKPKNPMGPVFSLSFAMTFVLWAMVLEASIITVLLLAGDTIKTESVAEPGTEEKLSTAFEIFISDLVDKVVTIQFWQLIGIYVVVFFLFPSLIGMVADKSEYNPTWTFAFCLIRLASAYLLAGAPLVGPVVDLLPLKLFNVMNVLGVMIAFWEHTKPRAEKASL